MVAVKTVVSCSVEKMTIVTLFQTAARVFRAADGHAGASAEKDHA
jgi:hypothetical protein